MEAAALLFNLKDNINKIIGAFNSKLETRTMPYNVSIPLEVDLLAGILRLHGLNFTSATTGAKRLEDFQGWFLQHEQQATEVMHHVLEDKRAYIKTDQGTVLQKEMLIRRLEFFNETAHTLVVMMQQKNLKSPKHHIYPYLTSSVN
ncbi:hypothetical protein FVR03_12880 [Pontibacter qinzhouensis]|uniref:Uncharacterized protein n=1 Tax=Pontibacter qinzhouensis TaxID=2603253 RepID=A0A5C8K773_9BACT|nr:hypothetical protein [Pontibacter qinzhouensis]TXK44922.1 hypothetical protein FVR03_12880 [Pontibacter qinzhouensis]